MRRSTGLPRAGIVGVVLQLTMPVFAATPDLERARRFYERSEYGTALEILQALSPKDGSAFLLTGQCYYMSGDAKGASTFLEKAVASEPLNPRFLLWLGRAYNRRAETANILAAPNLRHQGQAQLSRWRFGWTPGIWRPSAICSSTISLLRVYWEGVWTRPPNWPGAFGTWMWRSTITNLPDLPKNTSIPGCGTSLSAGRRMGAERSEPADRPGGIRRSAGTATRKRRDLPPCPRDCAAGAQSSGSNRPGPTSHLTVISRPPEIC